MKYIAAFCLFLASFSTFSDTASLDIKGYGKTTWGMPASEVIATDPERISKLDPPEVFAGSTALLGIALIKFGVADFDARFLFDPSGNLKQVNLSSKQTTNVGINRQTFSAMEQQITEKYGAPTYKAAGSRISWKMPSTTIDLSHLYIPGITTQVSVTYKPTADKSHNDL